MISMISGISELLEVAREGFLVEISETPSLGELLSASSADGDNLLHVASARGRLDEVAILVGIGFPLNLKGDYGYTALHYAAEAGSRTVYDFLVQNEADPSIKNSYGDLAFELFSEKSGE